MHPIWRPLWDGRGEGEEWPFVERKEEEDEANDSENVIINSPFQTRKGESNIPFRPTSISGRRLSSCFWYGMRPFQETLGETTR